MAAVPIYVWNGTAWQETGPTIPANPIKYQASAPSSPSTGDIWVDSDADVTTGSQQFQRFRFVASGGETTISGADANGAVLAYTAGLEQVVLNGAVLVRGSDYTATNGTSITGLSPALVASDVLEVFSFIAFTVANTYTQSQVDGLIAGAISLAIFNETQSSGTEGGANTNGSYTKRTLNTTIVNTITGCSIASSVITLPAGTYHVTASAPALAVNGHRIRFRNTSDSTTAVLGATGYTATSAPNNDRAILDGYFIITGSKNFELQHMTATLKTGNGLGAAQSQDALGEVYSVVTIRKIA